MGDVVEWTVEIRGCGLTAPLKHKHAALCISPGFWVHVAPATMSHTGFLGIYLSPLTNSLLLHDVNYTHASNHEITPSGINSIR